jgi:hypothetical protein
MKIYIFLSLLFASFSASAYDFQYSDGLFGSYNVATTAKKISLHSGKQVISFDITKCNEKLVNIYLKRLSSSLARLQPSNRSEIHNRVVMKGKTYHVSPTAPEGPYFRNLPSETHYLTRAQAYQCRKGRVPAYAELTEAMAKTDVPYAEFEVLYGKIED